MTLYIKNMVCQRCVQAVGEALSSIGLHANKIGLGEVDVKEPGLSQAQLAD